jgi:hypothetical protein
METMEFELRERVFYVQSLMVRQVCDALTQDPGTLRSVVRSAVSAEVFQIFLSAIEGDVVEVANDNVDDLWALCDEFQFLSLLRRVEAFKVTPTYKIERQNARIEALERQFEERSQHFQTQEASLDAAVFRLLQVEADMDRQSQEISTVAEENRRLAAAVGALHNWQQTTAEETRLEVGQLKADVDGLKRALADHQKQTHEQSETQKRSLLKVETDLERQSQEIVTATAGVHNIRGGQNDLIGAVGQLRADVLSLKSWVGPWFSVIVSDFPEIFAEFRGNQFSLLWRGGRDGFSARDFHSRCDGHANTLTLIEDTNGNIFGGFTPVTWESTHACKADPSLKSFLFTLKNPHNVPARRFALKVERKDEAIHCYAESGPCFNDIDVWPGYATHTLLGHRYTNDTGLDGETFFTGSFAFQVKEIETFEITGSNLEISNGKLAVDVGALQNWRQLRAVDGLNRAIANRQEQTHEQFQTAPVSPPKKTAIPEPVRRTPPSMKAAGPAPVPPIPNHAAAPPVPAQNPIPAIGSKIISYFPAIFAEFRRKRFSLLWRGGRDGFGARDFHNRCDGHANTLTLIEDTNGNIFGGFTPVKWESSKTHWFGDDTPFIKSDTSLKSFLFTLNNPHNVPARRFVLKAEKKDKAICCDSDYGPHFNDIYVSDNSNAKTNSCTELGCSYTNDTGLDGKTLFTGSKSFQVKEIEVFEITD